MKRQTDFFLAGHTGVAPSDGLYVSETGGSNASDALPSRGAQRITVWSAPHLGLTPMAASFGPQGAFLGSNLLLLLAGLLTLATVARRRGR